MSIQSILIPAIAEEFELDESVILPEADIYDTLDLDSISLIDLVGLVQSRFGLHIEKEDLARIKTFQDLYDYVAAHQS